MIPMNVFCPLTAPNRSLPTQPFRLFDLPAELRQKIYSYTLYRPSPGLFPYTWICPSRTRISPTCLTLLLVCRQIYVEAFALFYRLNSFYFDDTFDLHDFLRSIGPARRAEVKALRFRWTPDAWSKLAFRLLKTCERLEYIKFGLGNYQPPGYAALREVRGLRVVKIKPAYWMDGRGTSHLKADKEELEQAMTRPKMRRDVMKEGEGIGLFRRRRETKRRKTEAERLLGDWPLKWRYEMRSITKLRK